ncbi:MAG: hypothetical protein R3D55_13285 [Chloroflexota bacterium]
MPFTKPAHDDGFGFVVNGDLHIRVHSTIVLRYVAQASNGNGEETAVSLTIDQKPPSTTSWLTSTTWLAWKTSSRSTPSLTS